jgi:hypothetical protein
MGLSKPPGAILKNPYYFSFLYQEKKTQLPMNRELVPEVEKNTRLFVSKGVPPNEENILYENISRNKLA